MDKFEQVLALLAAAAVLTPLTQRLRLAQPIGFVLGGLLLSLAPGFPSAPLDPDVIFLVCMPPLLHVAAYVTSWREFRRHLTPISLMATGLVVFTAGGVALVFHALLPAIPLAAGFALGAVVSPPDAVAVAAVARDLRLPKRIMVVLEGESLVNDATGLVVLRFALAALATGRFSLAAAAGKFVLVAGGGIALGLAAGWLVCAALRRVREDALGVLISLIQPYIVYLVAERLGCSGVLAVVAGGIYAGWELPRIIPFSMRIQGRATWRMVDYLLNGVVFLLIGLQLPYVVRRVDAGHGWGEIAGLTAAVCGAVVLLRPAWTFVMAPGWRLALRPFGIYHPLPPWRHLGVVSWAGVRGVVSLAAALALPERLPGGAPFPARELIIFLTFAVILVTLVVQGLTFPAVVRALGVHPGPGDHHARGHARRRLVRAALQSLDGLGASDAHEAAALEALRVRFQSQIKDLEDEVAEALGWSSHRHRESAGRKLLLHAVAAQRGELNRLRRHEEIDEEEWASLSRELDYEEAFLRS